MTRDDDRVPAWRRYLRFSRANSAGDVDDELTFHLESAIDEYIASGLSRADAIAAARHRFGDVGGISKTLYTLSEQRERTMDRGERWEAFKQDIVFGLRQLRKTPGFTVVALLTLALGIGATSAIFSVVYSVLLRPMPFANADRIVTLSQMNGKDTIDWVPFGNWNAWRARSQDFVAVGATWGGGNVALTGNGEPVSVMLDRASADYFRAMFVPPAAGRYFSDEEEKFNGPNAAILSYAIWQSRFGGRRDVVGSTITLNGIARTVVGVAAPEYIMTPPAERIWVPLVTDPPRMNDFSDHELRVWGLLKPGVSAATAAAHLREIETPLAREHPHNSYDGHVATQPLIDRLVGNQRSNLYMLLGAVALVLLIACANIANLLLARAQVRQGEMAIRGALGASRGRIVAQLLCESGLLAVGGAALGLLVAYVGMRFLITGPDDIPRLQETSLNLPVVAFTLLIAVCSAIVFGLVPAIRASRTDLQQTLREAGRDSRGLARDGLRAALVVAELCIAQVLLIGAALLIRSAIRVQAVPAGFDLRNVLGVSIALPSSRYKAPADRRTAFTQLEAAVSAIPGVKSVAYAQQAPIYGNGWSWMAFREGSDGHDDGAAGAEMRFVSPSYFSTLEIHLVRGRAFTRADVSDSSNVAIVSRGLARKLFGTEDVVGKRISNGSVEKPNWQQIVGVAEDIHARGLAEDTYPTLYLTTMQLMNPSQTFMVRGNVPVQTLTAQIRRAVATVDPQVPLSQVMTIEAASARQRAVPRFATWLLVLLGGTGLVLAVVGVYGVISYFVTQRRHELGVRLALGASTGSLQQLVVRQGLTLALVGVAFGIPLSLAATRVLHSLMFGISERDPLTFGGVAAMLALVALLASYIPARRATRIDPLEALRSS